MNVYLDMDGLLANLFDKIAYTRFNKPYAAKDANTPGLTDEEKKEAKRVWYDRAHFIDNFGDVKEFFATLPPFGEHGEITKAIIDTVVKIAGKYNICSHPAGIDSDASEAGKRIWIKKHLSPPPEEMYFPQSKAIYATTDDGIPNVLIDDFAPYLRAWEEEGGIPIEMRTDKYHSKQQIESFLTKELNKAKKRIDNKIPTFKQYANKAINNTLK